MKASATPQPTVPPALHQNPVWSLPGSLPENRQAQCREVEPTTLPMVGLEWECGLQECVRKPQECQSAGRWGECRMPEFRASICHVCGTQNPGFEQLCGYLLAVLPEDNHLTSLSLVSSSVKRRYFFFFN
jgi:hypothetical protein